MSTGIGMCIQSISTQGLPPSLNLKALKLLSFNVENLEPKLDEPDFINLIASHDISFLCETWRKEDTKLNLHGLWDFSQIRPKAKKAGRYSGGITIFVKEEIHIGIKVTHNSEGFLWVKLSKSFFSLPNDLYLCAAYIPPKSSTSHSQSSVDYFQDLSNTLLKYVDKGNIIMLGDFNSRIGRANPLDQVSHPVIDNLLPPETLNGNTIPRSSCDATVNAFGKKLSSTCKAFDFRVANGQCPGDQLGNFTCHTKNGASVVDLVITDSEIFEYITRLKVLPPSFLSADSPISLSLKCFCSTPTGEKGTLSDPPPKLIWDSQKKESISKIFDSPIIVSNLNDLKDQLTLPRIDGNKIDITIEKFCHLMVSNASTCLKLHKRKYKTSFYKKTNPRSPKWYDSECRSLRNRLNNLARILNKQPNNPTAKSKMVLSQERL